MAEENANTTTTDLAIVSQQEENDSSPLIEITTYIREDQFLALEMLANAARQGFGSEFDRANLIQEAIDLLIEKHFAVVDLRKKNLKRSNT